MGRLHSCGCANYPLLVQISCPNYVLRPICLGLTEVKMVCGGTIKNGIMYLKINDKVQKYRKKSNFLNKVIYFEGKDSKVLKM